ncbi:MAG: hypothetical protein WCF12_13215 [Propionicimonas sp.]
MKVVVVYKWARDAAAAAVRADGTVDWRNAKMTAGEDDPAALTVAKQLAAASGGEVVGLTIGDGDASWVLARGVGSTFSVTDVPSLADNARTAAIIAAAVGPIGGVDVVVIGDSKQDPGVGVALAGALGWPALVGLVSANVEGGRVVAVRRVGTEEQTVAVRSPVVLGIAADADVDRAPGMKELLAARKRPVTTLTVADLGVQATDVSSEGTRKPAVVPTRVFVGPPAETAAQLVAALRAEGVL